MCEFLVEIGVIRISLVATRLYGGYFFCLFPYLIFGTLGASLFTFVSFFKMYSSHVVGQISTSTHGVTSLFSSAYYSTYVDSGM